MRRLLFLSFCLFSSILSAQCVECKPPQYWLVQKVHVKANAVTAYETHVKMLVNQLQNYAQGCSPLNWFAFVSPDQSLYTYVTPVQDFKHLQEIYATMKEEGNAYAQLHQTISQEVMSWDVSFLMPMPSLSYQPKDASANVQPYNIIESIEVIPGMQSRFEKAMGNWAQNAAEGKSSAGWSVFVTLIGPNQPQYSIVYNGSSVNSFKNQFAEMSKSGNTNQVKGFGVLRSYSWSSNIFVPELSNVNAPHPRATIPQN